MTEKLPHPLLELESIPEREKYLLETHQDIVQNLQDLARRPTVITAYFNAHRDSISTTIIDVLTERNLLVFEPGPSNSANLRLLKATQAICIARYNDIDMRFTIHEIRRARYRDQDVFACPIPDSLLRLQRREFFRVSTPLMNPILCHFTSKTGKATTLPLADISIGGICLTDEQQQFDYPNGDIIERCTLEFPDDPKRLVINLLVRATFMVGKQRSVRIQRIGCEFTELDPRSANFIQRYISRLQIQQKNLLQPNKNRPSKK